MPETTYQSFLEYPFIQNKYYHFYCRLIERAKERSISEQYSERHHILPKCHLFYGSNKKENIVRLYPREHFVAYICLCQCTEGAAKDKMTFAVSMLAKRYRKFGNAKINGRTFERLRIEHAKCVSERLKGVPKSAEHRAKMPRPLKGSIGFFNGHKHSDISKSKMRLAKLGKPGCRTGQTVSLDTRNKISKSHKELGIHPPSRKGVVLSPEIRRKNSEGHKGLMLGKRIHIGPNDERRFYIPGTAPEGFIPK